MKTQRHDASSMTSRTNSGQMINSLQLMRGLAAIAVAIYHTNLILARPEYGGADIFRSVAAKGWLGVNFFFLLSGFIILFAHVDDIGKPERAGRYIWRRIIRLYPIYWFVLAAYLAAAFLGLGHTRFEWSPINLASAVLLVKLNEPLTLPLQVAWTLFYELTFYGIFTIAILNRAAGIVVLAGWVIAILWNSLALGDTRMGPLHIWNIYFLCGAAVFFLSRRADGRWGLPALVTGIAMLVILTSFGMSDRINDVQVNAPMLLALVAPFSLIMFGAVLAERTHGFRPHQFLMLLGAASYSIYLVHSPAISVMAILASKFFPDVLPPPLLFAMTVLLSVVAGVIVHLFIEKPVLERLRSPLIGKPEAAR